MPLRLNHAVMPWLPQDRQRVVLFFTFIPQVHVCQVVPVHIFYGRPNMLMSDHSGAML